jgi:hypothetical protein
MFTTTHDNRPATIWVTEDSVYAVYEDNHDVFYYTGLDDDSVDLAEELTAEFGVEMAQEVLAEVGVI